MYIQIRTGNNTFGGICDDGFGINEANVVCRELGYKLGAKEALGNSYFGHGGGKIVIEQLVHKSTFSYLIEYDRPLNHCRHVPETRLD